MMAGMLPRIPAMRTRETVSGPGRLTVDATRELTKCANGDLVSHEIVRDGIDALLQLRTASYSTSTSETQHDWTQGQQQVLRTRPEAPFSASRFGHTQRTECPQQDDNSEEEDLDDEIDDCSTCRSSSPVPEHRQRPAKQNPTHHRLAPPPPTKPRPKPPAARPPTIWHHRKTATTAQVTPDSPKSKVSVESLSRASDDESEEASGPAVLHFSCLQCHRAKKRCDRTKPCSRCLGRGMEKECRYPDKHDPRSVLRACLRCWQTKKKCDRKQPSCGKCDKVGVKCVYRRENQESTESSPIQIFQIPTPTLTMSPPPTSRLSRLPSDASSKANVTPPPDFTMKKRKMADDGKSQLMTAPKKRAVSAMQDTTRQYSTRRRNSTSTLKSELPSQSELSDTKRSLRSRK